MKLYIVLSTVFLFLFGCSSVVTSRSLLQNDWQVERLMIGDSAVIIEGEEHPTLSFDADSTFGGETLCNSISGVYHTTPSGAISMSIDAITTAFCPENTIEGLLIEQIAMSHHYTVVGDTLRLKDVDGRTLILLSTTVIPQQ